MNKMILANLLHRPVRSLISIVAIAVEVTLILVIVGLSLGMLNDAKNRTVGIGADLMVQPPGSSFLSGISGAPVPAKVGEVIAKLPNVQVVSPVVTQLSTSGALEVIYGIDIDSFQKLGGPFKFIEGGPFQDPNDILVDDYFAAGKSLHVGSTMQLLNHTVRVAGIVQHGKGARKFLPIATLQDWTGSQGKASIFYVKVDDPKNISAVEDEVHNTPGMQQYVVRSMAEYLSLMTAGNLPGLSQFITVVIGVAVVIGFIVIFQAMYTAVMERTREIGILKSLGASKLYIINVILRETSLLAVFGIILGVIASIAVKHALKLRFATLTIEINGEWITYAVVIALAGAVLGAIYPAFKAAQKDPIEALAYE